MARRHQSMTMAIVCGVAASMAIGASSAMAQDEPVVVQAPAQDARVEYVSHADLDLGTAQGTQRLANRVGGAIERVCEIDLGRDGLQDRGYYRCAGAAWSDAQAQISKAAMATQLASGDAPSLATATIAVRAIAR